MFFRSRELMKTRSGGDARHVHLVTGGAGFPGFSLGKRLAQMGHRVRLLDINEPVWIIPEDIDFVKVCYCRAVIETMGKSIRVQSHKTSLRLAKGCQTTFLLMLMVSLSNGNKPVPWCGHVRGCCFHLITN